MWLDKGGKSQFQILYSSFFFVLLRSFIDYKIFQVLKKKEVKL